MWRLMPEPVVVATPEAFLGIVQNNEVEQVTIPEPPPFIQPDPKNPIVPPPPK